MPKMTPAERENSSVHVPNGDELLKWFEKEGALHDWTVVPPGKVINSVEIAPTPMRHERRWHTTLRGAIWSAYRRYSLKTII